MHVCLLPLNRFLNYKASFDPDFSKFLIFSPVDPSLSALLFCTKVPHQKPKQKSLPLVFSYVSIYSVISRPLFESALSITKIPVGKSHPFYISYHITYFFRITLFLVVPSSDAFWPTSDVLWLSYIKILTTPDSGYFLQSVEGLDTKTQHISLSLKKVH